MERRFEIRKHEIEQDAKVGKTDVCGATSRLVRFLKPYFQNLPRSETRENATTFVKGLLSDLDRKNTESIAYRFGRDRRALQRFLGEIAWDDKEMRNRLAKQAAKVIGEEDGILAFDPSGFEKDGKKSAGVARQWLGRFGKVDNGQIGTFLAYVTRKEHVLVNAKLFIPQEWNDDPERCRRAKIPETEYQTHKTRHEHCLDMLDEQGELLPHKWITGDDELGRSSGFRRALRKREEQYCLAVPSDTNVRDLKNIPEYSGRGTPPKGTFVRVDTLKQSLNGSDWETIDVRDGEKGPLKMKLAVFHVLARTERSKRSGNESEWLIVVERPKGSGVQCDYYLSNAADGTSYDEFARVVLASHRVEDCFRRAKSECGLADYEVQSWIGWHHHVTLCLLATWFLTKETFQIKKKFAIVDRAGLPRAGR